MHYSKSYDGILASLTNKYLFHLNIIFKHNSFRQRNSFCLTVENNDCAWFIMWMMMRSTG